MSIDVERLGREAADALGLADTVLLPAALTDLLVRGVETVVLGDAGVASLGDLGASELDLLGTDMADYYRSYEFATYMPGAWPLALDGGGGFFCLDLRGLVSGEHVNDGRYPIVWSHAGNLGWGDYLRATHEGEVCLISDDTDSWLAVAVDDGEIYPK
ncbi:MAG: hypothetical protein FWF02_09625 [Micrococcales bacterium]|nr:hypothetical protein [Micrococcales bacterium]MCL2667948.1 hypothetical protein [Micrococcales bacterium]